MKMTDVNKKRIPRTVSMLRGTGIMIVLMLMAAITSFTVNAAAPPAGTVIGNQASATYTDASLIARTATSNTVTTIVQQVASLTLTTNGQAKTVSPGGTVYYPHTVTNTGNGTDSFTLTATEAAGPFTLSNLAIYADADGNGVPDNSTPITTTGNLAAGGVYKIVIAAMVPSSATSGQSKTITVTGTSVFTGSVNQTNTDTVNITSNGVVNVTKSFSISSGDSPSSGPITVTLTYTNTGNITAQNVTIQDVIGTGLTSGMTYSTGSGAWSGGSTVTDAAGGDSAGLTYDWNVTASNSVTAVIASLAPGATGKISFAVRINSGLAPGTAATSNTATYTYNDGASTIGPVNTNTATYSVSQKAGVVANGSSTSNVDGTSEPVTVALASQGAIVSFNNYVWNTGNGTDSFDISVNSGAFPAGTTFQLFKSDGVTPLTDSNANGIPDSGPVAPGSYYLVIVKATLPANTTGGPFNATVTAASFANGTTNNSVIDTLTAVSSSTVDITSNTARTDSSPAGTANAGNASSTGWGVGPEVASVTTNTVQPGASTTFVLVSNNTSSTADSYDLLVDQDGTFGNSNDLPAAWTAVFRLDGGVGNCSTTGATVTNTGVINAGANKKICALITVPAGQAAGNTELYFRARSSATFAMDVIHDRVAVSAVRSLSLTPNNSGQIYPGGTIVFTHTISNTGNVIEGNGTVSTIVLTLANSLSGNGWSSIVYYDLNGNGLLDASDPVVPAGGLHLTAGSAALADGLSLGESARLFVKVTAPAGATAGDINATTLTATTTNGTYVTTVPVAVTASDNSQVTVSQVRMTKTQALDATCTGTGPFTYDTAQIATGAVPGTCIRYQIVATNSGTATVTGVVVSDSTPPYTVYDNGSRNSKGGVCGTGPVDEDAATTVGSITLKPACDASGTVQATIGDLASGATATVTYGVMITN